MKHRTKTIMRRAVIALALAGAAVPALANHAWSTYHWIKGSGQLTVPVGDKATLRTLFAALASLAGEERSC